MTELNNLSGLDIEQMTDYDVAMVMRNSFGWKYMDMIYVKLLDQPIFAHPEAIFRLGETVYGWTEKVNDMWYIVHPSAFQAMVENRNTDSFNVFAGLIDDLLNKANLSISDLFDVSENGQNVGDSNALIQYLMQLPEALISGTFLPVFSILSNYCDIELGTPEEMVLRASIQSVLWLMPNSSRLLLKHILPIIHFLGTYGAVDDVTLRTIFAQVLIYDSECLPDAYKELTLEPNYNGRFHAPMMALVKYMVKLDEQAFQIPAGLATKMRDYLRNVVGGNNQG